MRKIDTIIVHCTDSDDSLDIGFREINEWHKQRGWLSESGISCGYHYIVRRNGEIETGRPDHERGAHAAGHNERSIGVVWVGRKNPGKNQMKRLLQVVRGLKDQYNVDIEKILGHFEVNSGKTCPNLDMDKFRAEILFTKSSYQCLIG